MRKEQCDSLQVSINEVTHAGETGSAQPQRSAMSPAFSSFCDRIVQNTLLSPETPAVAIRAQPQSPRPLQLHCPSQGASQNPAESSEAQNNDSASSLSHMPLSPSLDTSPILTGSAALWSEQEQRPQADTVSAASTAEAGVQVGMHDTPGPSAEQHVTSVGGVRTNHDDVIGSDEPVYCICRQVPFGEMIACGNSDCPIAWFHLHCVCLEESPNQTWMCPNCRDQIQSTIGVAVLPDPLGHDKVATTGPIPASENVETSQPVSSAVSEHCVTHDVLSVLPPACNSAPHSAVQVAIRTPERPLLPPLDLSNTFSEVSASSVSPIYALSKGGAKLVVTVDNKSPSPPPALAIKKLQLEKVRQESQVDDEDAAAW